jgi:hypothetical protein
MKRITDWEEAGRVVAKRIVRHTGLTLEEANAAVASILGCIRETDENGFLIVRDESGREVARVPESVLRGVDLPTG